MSIKKKYPLFALDNKYLDMCHKMDPLKLVIIGRDPFPSAAENIPFIKSSWAELDMRSAGHYLFHSLLSTSELNACNTPKDAAFFLLANNIVLLNASYNFLEEDKISEYKHSRFVERALEFNFPILERSNNVIMCGDAKQMLDWVISYDSNFISAPHPSLQSRNAIKDKSLWDNFWGSGELLKGYRKTQ